MLYLTHVTKQDIYLQKGVFSMKTVQGTLPFNSTYQLEHHYNLNKLLFFDIETTGFSPDYTELYLIGCVFYTDNHWNYIQWLNDNGTSEEELLHTFFQFIKPYASLIHYNGDGFDIPYLQNKVRSYGLSYQFNSITSIDLYKMIKPYKSSLYLDNLKQKTLEEFFGISRKDPYNGGELIKIYQNYLNDQSSTKLNALLLHNYEDISHLVALSIIVSYQQFFSGNFNILRTSQENDRYEIFLALPDSLPKRITKGTNGIILSAYKQEASLSIPILHDELKFFFSDYRNYYYLPIEDKAIHKSIASFVDKEYREKAKRSNCYVRKEGDFIIQYDSIIPGYQHNYNDPLSYLDIASSVMNDTQFLHTYCLNLLNHL